MDIATDELFADLEVISMVKESGRLCVNDGKLSIEPYVDTNGMYAIASWASLSFKRWWNQDSRDHAIVALQCVVMRCGNMFHDIVLSPEGGRGARLERLLAKCDAARTGLSNLRTTYKDDAATFARITMLMQRLEIIVSDINAAI